MSKADELEQARNDRLTAEEHEKCEEEGVKRDERLRELADFLETTSNALYTAKNDVNRARRILEELQA